MSDSHDAAPAAAHGTRAARHADHGDIDRHVRAAYYVFGSLLLLTGFTVAAYFIHLPTKLAIALALAIASVKGSLVAAWFMHLVSERVLIYWVLAITAAMFIPLLLLPVFTALDPIALR
jgi:cytochrome c oxidase subunit 4